MSLIFKFSQRHSCALVFCFLVFTGLVRADDSTGTSPTSPGVDGVRSLSPFGLSGDYHTSQVMPKWMPQMTAIGIKVLRCASPDGKDQMDYLDSLGVKYGIILYCTPPGDTLDKGGLPVKDLGAWKAFLTDQYTKAKGRPYYWELWNEPPNGIAPGQTAADYAKLLVTTYDTLKALDPNAVVAMCAKSVHVNWLEQTIQAGGKDHFDCIILHPYEVLGCAMEHPGAEPVYMNIVPTVRKMLAAQDPAKVNVPIIFTELGFDSSRGPNLQANALLKAYTMGIAQGVTTIDWFEGMDGDSGPWACSRATSRRARPTPPMGR